ncbi:MAG: septum formation initiator family protein [Bacteroidales bacterium]|jgi:cell division protein FtsB|nr:septum formation initiator family protein [Bacteroidales bacterium]
MEEQKDKWAWLKKSDHNYLVPFVIVTTTLVALWLLFFAHNSVLSWIRATMEEKNQQKEMARLKEEIEEMDREIRNLRNNPDTLETFARETYHFAAPGDDVYIVE